MFLIIIFTYLKQIQMAREYSTGQCHVLNAWNQPFEISMAILDQYIYLLLENFLLQLLSGSLSCHFEESDRFFCKAIKTEGLFSLAQLFSYLIKRFYDLWLFYDLWCIVFQPLIYGYTTIWPKFRKVGKSNKLSGRKADTQLYGICSRKREGHSITTVPARLQASAR